MDNRKVVEKAIALRYDEERDRAPVLIAKGRGFLAEKIKEVAQESGVPLREDKELTNYLMAFDLYAEIPPELYAVVAEILAYIYQMDRRFYKE